MIIYNSLNEAKIDRGTAIAMGNFDGMHLGHQALVSMAVAGAKARGLRSAVFTFENNPKNVMAGERVVKNIMLPEDRAKFMERLGIDYLLSMPFDDAIRDTPPDRYVRELLVGRFGMAAAYCGFNHRFGARAAGDAAFLERMGAAEGFDVHVLEPQEIGGRLVSSSLIRGLILEGKVDECAAFLGRNYSAGGEVVMGNQLGRTIGFPTVNILIDDDMAVPAHGVYVTCCHLAGAVYPGVTNVGVRPTIGDEKKSIETHLFDMNEDLYGKHISVEFFKRVREERKFDGLPALAEQIGRDCAVAREFHGL
ncbi:MAG: bifunctional riboflavin kinase/FAD synthetase [Clostridiales Family XIII bacterium]|jgi:riboflavin kinase/FMN adenylyltransferase|nr:bifunctional riboflavin kinase/FAD synthetase [Clostridiales Family XIII bacterium]